MLDTSQSYPLLRRGSTENESEKHQPLEKQQRSPPRWKDILFVISGLMNVAALFSIISYLSFSSPSTHGCTATTTEYPQTSYSKPEPAVTLKGEKVRGKRDGLRAREKHKGRRY